MIKRLNESESLKFKSISQEEKSKKGILGRLWGPVASFAAPTRNGRKYTQDLWEKLFDSDLIKERFKNGGIFGQLCHPDYEDVDMEKIAIVMPEPPVRDNHGNLIAYVDIIDTPCGRIAYQLAKYGYNFGISSRGTGDLIEGIDGEEVDPDTYNLTAFDLVEIPAVENARLAFTESLNTKKIYNKTLKQRLSEELNNASDSDKKIMKEALNTLNIKLNEARVLTKSGPTAKQEEHEIVDSFVDEKGERHFKLDTNVWVTEKDVDSIEADEAKLAELDAKHATEVEATVTEAVEEDEAEFVKVNWEKILKGIKNMGGSVDSLTKVYDEMMNAKEGNDKLAEDDSSFGAIDEALDTSIESDFNEYSDGVSMIYGALENVIKSCQYNAESNVSFGDLENMFEEALMHLHDEWDLEESCKDEAWDISKEDDFGKYSDATSLIYGVLEKIVKNGANEKDLRNAFESAVMHLSDEYDIEADVKNESCNEACSDKEVEEEVGNAEDLKELQEALLKNSELEKDNLSLQEKLSVSNAKEMKLEEELKKYKTSTAKLSQTAKSASDLKKKLGTLEESLAKKEKLLETNKQRFNELVKQKRNLSSKINESAETVSKLQAANKQLKSDLSEKTVKLDEAYATVKKYEKSLKVLRESYVDAKASANGLKKEDVLSRLNESYALKDVDKICEELSNYKRNMSKLPFRVTDSMHINFKSSDNEYIKANRNAYMDDDYVDDSLLRLVNLD